MKLQSGLPGDVAILIEQIESRVVVNNNKILKRLDDLDFGRLDAYSLTDFSSLL